MAFNPDDYEPVAARLDRALKEHSDMRVITELVHYLADVAVFKAEIWLSNDLMATGWAEEVRGQGNVNRTSHVENAETSAIGRALANMGYAGSDFTKRPSREEMQKVQRAGGNQSTPQPGRTIKNKFPNPCHRCGGRVESGEGIAIQNANGKWETFHNSPEECTVEDPF